ncbi:sterile alpha motif domain-containing protein 9-like [Bombina bombina]|uniref:sterile alpha motif domain-containing protein 9-like n=1 Tax=Bombina bombina TaxID=8345 RepID=UPI00235A82EF|nr:sterile alpha motif domain-containing protein 9-like [Bombina bombina]
MDEEIMLPANTNDWTKDHVKFWVSNNVKIEPKEAEILYTQNVSGEVLKELLKDDLVKMGLTYGSAVLIGIHLRKHNDKLNIDNKRDSVEQNKQISTQKDKKESARRQGNTKCGENIISEARECSDAPANSTIQPQTEQDLSKPENTSDNFLSKQTCQPFPFDTVHDGTRYRQHYILPPESGPSNYIEPVHEYKEFTNTANASEEDKKIKFCNEVFRFAAACMNTRTNGTIHFGVCDKPHGEIIGIQIENKDKYINYFSQMIVKYFEGKQLDIAKKCIRPPRFVEVLYQDNLQSDRVVIEVDVVPNYHLCKSEIFQTFQQIDKNGWKRSKDCSCFVREGASSRDILANIQHNSADYKDFCTQVPSRDDVRKQAEEHKITVNPNFDGVKLVRLITGDKDTLDNSYYKRYILVTNKCHPNNINHLNFIHEIKWFAVLDFDPESLISGICKYYREKRVANLHFPNQFQEMNIEKSEELKLYQQTSWIFCNGRSDLKCKDYEPVSSKEWQKSKAAEVGKLVSFFTRKDVMERGKFLVIFLLLSMVEDPADPMNEVFRMFFQELGGINDILCICETAQIFQRWKDLQLKYVNEKELEDRCVYNLSVKNINGTILKLKSQIQSTKRILPSDMGSSILLPKKDEEVMTCLEILCENECQDTELEKCENKFNTFMTTKEEHFYRGGKVSWWNFYFSMRNFTGPFIKRDVYDKLEEMIKSCSNSQKQISVKTFTLYHHVGCGGTTVAKHILWDLRNTFRCAVLKQNLSDHKEIGEQVVNLATYGCSDHKDYFPVLLLVDDCEEDETYVLQNYIQAAIAEKNIKYDKPAVIILNCTRSQNPEQTSIRNCLHSVSLTHVLSPQEQRAFEAKLKTIEKQHNKPDNFYSFMILKSNFDENYIKNIVRNILKGLNIERKEDQLIAYLAMLNTYICDSTLSASICEDFLGITGTGAFWGKETIEEKMGIFFTIMLQNEFEECGKYQGIRIIHPLIAKHCLDELRSTFDLCKSDIVLNLLGIQMFYERSIGRDKFVQNMKSMLITRHRKEHGDETDTLFSPLIEDIRKEEGNESVKKVLEAGVNSFKQTPYICQALARHFYLREKNFSSALEWANKAKKIAPGNSFILNTLGQIYKCQLKSLMDKKNHLTADKLKNLLETAVFASETFEQCQVQAGKGEAEREDSKLTKSKRTQMYNIAGYLGQIEVYVCTVEILLQLPWLKPNDVISKKQLLNYLSGKRDISVENTGESYTDFFTILTDFRYFLIKIKSKLEVLFTFFDDYFVYLKQKNMMRESTEFKTNAAVSDLFKIYRKVFCNENLIQTLSKEDGLKGSNFLHLEKIKAGLESYKADRFSGILQYLTKKDQEKLEAIVKAYKYLLDHQTNLEREKQNFILANIVLQCVFPKSKYICPMETLKNHLRLILQDVGFDCKDLEPYFLASLLFWPQSLSELDNDSKDLAKCIPTMKKIFKEKYKYSLHSKQPIAHFFLGRHKRLIHRGKIDEHFKGVPGLNFLWQDGEIWKEKPVQDILLRVNGRTENKVIYLEIGNDESVKIPVRPAHFGQLRRGNSIESVSFYLGFSIDGPIAYGIESRTYANC